jgi:pimeloyl-ACP methyl ester carboxylesterase
LTTDAAVVQRIRRAEGLGLHHEVLAVRDFLCLHASPVCYGHGVPRGDGSAVIVVPGFLGSDRYLLTIYHWLRRIGYRPYYSGIGRNYDCPELLVRRLLLTMEQARLETGRPVQLVGHSLGGTLARVAASRAPDNVRKVITLGSPLQAARVHSVVLMAQHMVRRRIQAAGAREPECYSEACRCDFVGDVTAPFPAEIRRHAIYTRSDGVLRWEDCVEPDPALNVEVRSTHLGLVFNPEAYRAIARLLAGA